MKKLICLFFPHWLLLFSISFSFAFGLTNQEIIQNSNNKYLSGRVYAMLQLRLQGISRCESSVQTDFNTAFRSLPKHSEDLNLTQNILALYHKSYGVSPDCLNSLNAAEMNFHNSERKLFSKYFSALGVFCDQANTIQMVYNNATCGTQWRQILLDLNPHCISTQVPFDPKYHDGFICMVGDILIGKLLAGFFPDPNDQVLEIKNFFWQYWNQSQINLPTGQRLELYSLFKKDKTDNYQTRHRFLAIMTFLLASTKSTSPYIKGFQDNIWRSHLLNTGDVKKSVSLFNQFRSITDEFKTIHGIITSKKIPVTMLNQEISKVNRHNSMAMFLSCHYIRSGKGAHRALPVALGYAYETFDFRSHLKEGDTIKQARKNFVDDTRRYRSGVMAGEQFCSLQ